MAIYYKLQHGVRLHLQHTLKIRNVETVLRKISLFFTMVFEQTGKSDLDQSLLKLNKC